MQPLQPGELLDLDQVVGRKAVTEEDAARNAVAAKNGRNLGPRRPREAVRGILPISRTSFLSGVKRGIYPAPIRLGKRTFWRSDDIAALIQQAA